jgi:hypothetical protein
MKRLFSLVVFTTFALTGFGQKSVEALFKKYANSDGFVTISINGDLLKFVDNLDDDKDIKNDDDNDRFPFNVTEIKILAQDKDKKQVANFYDQVINDLNRSDYEEFMSVNKSDQKMIMLIRTEGRRIKEFLLVAGGEDNALIQIKGDLTFKDAKKLSEDFKDDHHMDLLSKKN